MIDEVGCCIYLSAVACLYWCAQWSWRTMRLSNAAQKQHELIIALHNAVKATSMPRCLDQHLKSAINHRACVFSYEHAQRASMVQDGQRSALQQDLGNGRASQWMRY